jgi:hypothetical protein
MSALGATAGAQIRTTIRTPIATAPLTTSTQGPAPTNVKAVATSPTSVALSWDAASGVRSYLVERRQTDNPTCCVLQSGLMTTSSWQDGALTAGAEYSFVVTVVYNDGSTGSTEVMAATPYGPSVSLSAGAVAASDALRLTPCAQRISAGPDPGVIQLNWSSPAGAELLWYAPSPPGTNYVVERAPSGSTSWGLVGSTCGGPSPVSIAPPDATGKVQVGVHDYSGGVRALNKYTYRVTRLGPKGEVGWQTFHWTAPCVNAPQPTATASGSTVTVKWSNALSLCMSLPSTRPETFTLTSSFGFVKTKTRDWTEEIIYGVPVGTHTFSMVGGWRTGGTTTTSQAVVTVSY